MRRVLAAAAIVLLSAGCTGVPTSSAPETIEALDSERHTALPSVPPNLNADPRLLVQSFLAANASDTGNHNAARAYLTSVASNRWSDTTATIIANDFSIGTYNPRKQTVTVVGRVLGTLNQNGIYTPSLLAQGEGGEKQPFVFDIVQIGNQWRIGRLQGGLLLTDQQFRVTYQQRVLYFYDVAGSSLVPDLRWSALDDRTRLAEWLLTQLVDGPRPELENAVTPDTLPAQIDARQMTVTLGTPTRIEIPGASQLDQGVRDRLAAQLSETLLETLAGRDMTVTDSGTPVIIPAVGSDRFTADDFIQFAIPPVESKVYYLNGGHIRDEAGVALPGPVGDVSLTSFAISQARSAGPLLVAGVVGSAPNARLEVGTAHDGLTPTSVVGSLSRPSFVPSRGEVWIGDGSQAYRVTVGEGEPRVHKVPFRAVTGGGDIRALRVSPEGSRIAAVVSGAGGSAQLYVGSIVRGPGSVSVDGLVPISPQGVVVTDVAWLDSFKLFAIGYLLDSQDSKTFETGVDGTEWANFDIGNLPSPPESVTAATASSVWVAADDYVWKQSGNSWVSPGPTGQTPGSEPVYLE